MMTPKDSHTSLLDRFFNLIESAPSSDRLILRITVFAVLVAGIWLAFSLNQHFSKDTPTRGGTVIEGIVGTPRFVNPALAITRADQDVTALVYSGLMKIGQDGNLVNNIADSINISEDGLTYNVLLKKDITFHDGEPLTANDVIYTIQLIQDPDLKSPLRGNWADITVEKVNEYELNIILDEAYGPFIENLTLSIMPAHVWSNLPIEQLPFSQLNTEPIGSGPFAVTKAKRDTSGLINYYELTAYNKNNEDPKIDSIQLNFYQNEDALVDAVQKHEIDATTYVPAEKINDVLGDYYQSLEEPLPRTFGVFFNQNKSSALRDESVREALTVAIDRDLLIESAFNGYGVPITGPTIFSEPELKSEDSIENTATTTNAEQAEEILLRGGWLKNNIGLWEKEIDGETVTLNIVLRTSNVILFDSLSKLIAKQWEAIGVGVTIEQFEQAGLVQSVIRPRDFQALLFGHDISRSYDLYPVWHSSQQDDPGLNVAQYANVSVDALLESAHTKQSETERIELLKEASEIIIEERPAIFIAQPTMIYIVSKNMTVAPMNKLGKSADRFSNIADWHTENDSLWSIFRDDM